MRCRGAEEPREQQDSNMRRWLCARNARAHVVSAAWSATGPHDLLGRHLAAPLLQGLVGCDVNVDCGYYRGRIVLRRDVPIST